MAATHSPTKHIPVRIWAFANDFMIFASSAIVTGVLSYFLNEFSLRNAHIIYQEVIAVVTLAVYTFAMVLPVFGDYRGQLLPFNFVMSYLWLTSFIFATQDWTGGRCGLHGPATSGCALKETIVAFDFLALFFLLSNVASEGVLWRSWRIDYKNREHHKERQASGATTASESNNATTV